MSDLLKLELRMLVYHLVGAWSPTTLVLCLFLCLFVSRQGYWLSWNSLCRPGCLELRNSPASASQVLGLKSCANFLVLN